MISERDQLLGVANSLERVGADQRFNRRERLDYQVMAEDFRSLASRRTSHQPAQKPRLVSLEGGRSQ